MSLRDWFWLFDAKRVDRPYFGMSVEEVDELYQLIQPKAPDVSG